MFSSVGSSRFTHAVAAPHRREAGLTLIELVVVLVVLVAVGALLVPLIGNQPEDARATATNETMNRIRDAISGPNGYATTMKHALDTSSTNIGYATGLPWPSATDVLGGRADHPQLQFLYVEPSSIEPYDPNYKVGWRDAWLDIASPGRYVVDATRGFSADYGQEDDSAPLDGWANPIVIQLPSDPSETFEDEVLAVRLVSAGPNGVIDTPTTDLTPEDKGDDIVLYLRREDPHP